MIDGPRLLVVALCVTCAVVPVFGQVDPCAGVLQGERFSEVAVAAWKARHAAVQQEIGNLKEHPWAGTYYHGDGLAVNATLTIGPKTGFTFILTGCTGVYDRNYGDLSITEDGTLELQFTYDDGCGIQGVQRALMPVKWDQRRYLVSEERVVDFCSAVNSANEPRSDMHGWFFLRDGDHEKPASDFPDLPKEYRKYLLDEPILAEIVEVGKTVAGDKYGQWTLLTTTVTLNVGQSDKVLSGMSFNVYEPENCSLFGSVRVLAVEEKSCTASIRQIEKGDTKPLQPKVGWKLTTGPQRGTSDVRPAAQPTSTNDQG